MSWLCATRLGLNAKTFTSFFLWGTFCLGMAGCGSTPLSNLEPPAAVATSSSVVAQPVSSPSQILGTGKIKAALILPLGTSGQTGATAASMRNAAELALSEFQNPDLHLTVKDDKGTPEGAREAVAQALEEGAELVLGPLQAPSVKAAAPLAQQMGRPVIAFSSDGTAASKGVYLLSFMPEAEVDRVVSHAVVQGKRSFAALIPDTAYGRVVEAAFQQSVARLGARIVVVERLPQDRMGMEAAARRLAQVTTGVRPQADALFVPIAYDALSLIGPSLQSAGFDPSKVKPFGTGLWNEPNALRLPILQGAWFAAASSEGFNAFAARYRARYGQEPARIATLTYDAVSLAAALIRTQGPQRFSEAVLTMPSGFSGTDGVFRFRPDGFNERGLAVFEVRNGEAAVVSPAPRILGQSGT